MSIMNFLNNLKEMKTKLNSVINFIVYSIKRNNY